MYISELDIKNYRNLDGINIKFHPEITFLVGENNLGKSNVLSLINAIFNKNRFFREDFYNIDEKILIRLTIVLNEYEKGMFSDLFDPYDNNRLNLIFTQDFPDEFINITHKDTGVNLSNNTMKKILQINYDSLRNPNNELSFEKGKGSGKFFKFLINRYLKQKDVKDLDFIDEFKLEELIVFINKILGKIKTFEDFEVTTSVHKEVEDLLSRILTLTDDNRFEINSSGYGVQYSLLIGLAILVRISNLTESSLDRMVYEKNTKDGVEKVVPLIFSLDEPEIHLHPYMQRTLIKYISNIILNKDMNFKSVLKELFNIDSIVGQSLIVTHSPNILLNDYKQIVRFYRDNTGNLIIKNGTSVNLPNNLEKHLLMNMHYIKETFFSRCVIIVEGESEYGCMDIFAEKIGIDLDESGISILKANGAESIYPLMQLFHEFGIESVGVIDKDKYIEKKKTLNNVENLLHTSYLDFEDEVVNKCFENNQIAILEEIVERYDSKGLTRSLQSNKLEKTAKKYNLEIDMELNGHYSFKESLNLDLLKIMYLAWFDINKSVILGREIGTIMENELIPDVYEQSIKLAQELLLNEDK